MLVCVQAFRKEQKETRMQMKVSFYCNVIMSVCICVVC